MPAYPKSYSRSNPIERLPEKLNIIIDTPSRITIPLESICIFFNIFPIQVVHINTIASKLASEISTCVYGITMASNFYIKTRTSTRLCNYLRIRLGVLGKRFRTMIWKVRMPLFRSAWIRLLLWTGQYSSHVLWVWVRMIESRNTSALASVKILYQPE